MRGKHLTPEKIAEIRELVKSSGLTQQQIADQLGLNVSSVRRHAGDVERTVPLSNDLRGSNPKYPSKEVSDWYNERYGTNLKPDDITQVHRDKFYDSLPERRATLAAANSRRRANIKSATQAAIPSFKFEIDNLFRLAKLLPGRFEVDHIKRIIDGGLHHPENLQLLKYELHRLKSGLEEAGRFEEAARVGKFNEYDLEPKLRSLLAENTPGLMSFLKPALKLGAKAVPILGYGAAAKGAVDYSKSGNPVLSAISGASAIPVLGDVFGLPLLGAEVVGNIWNRDKERMRKRKEGLLGEAPKRYRGFGGILN